MARKRASMREGPLAELFRATEAAQEQQQRQQQAGRTGKRSTAPAAKPDPDQPTVQTMLFCTPDNKLAYVLIQSAADDPDRVFDFAQAVRP